MYSTFIRCFKTHKLYHILKPSLHEITHPSNLVEGALFRFKDRARYGVYALQDSTFPEKTLKYIVENDLLPFVPSENDVYVVPAVNPVHRKRKGIQNGSGRAPIRSYFAKVKAGRVIMEFNALNDEIAAKLYHRMRSKLATKTYFRARPKTKEKTVLTPEQFVNIMTGKVVKTPNKFVKKQPKMF